MGPLLGMIRFGRLTLAQANLLSDRLDECAETEALAVNINEIDEAAGEWELLA